MDITVKIACTLIVVGFIGVMTNVVTCPPTSKIKYHLYSTIPMGIGALTIMMKIIWSS